MTRGSADKEALVRCIAVLKNGEPLVLFPEGERKSGPLVQPLFDGAAFVAAKANAPIVPVGIGGSEQVMPKGSKLIYPRKVHLIVGPTDRGARSRPGPRAAGRSWPRSRPRSTTSCSACSTRPRPAPPAGSPRGVGSGDAER